MRTDCDARPRRLFTPSDLDKLLLSRKKRRFHTRSLFAPSRTTHVIRTLILRYSQRLDNIVLVQPHVGDVQCVGDQIDNRVGNRIGGRVGNRVGCARFRRRAVDPVGLRAYLLPRELHVGFFGQTAADYEPDRQPRLDGGRDHVDLFTGHQPFVQRLRPNVVALVKRPLLSNSCRRYLNPRDVEPRVPMRSAEMSVDSATNFYNNGKRGPGVDGFRIIIITFFAMS